MYVYYCIQAYRPHTRTHTHTNPTHIDKMYVEHLLSVGCLHILTWNLSPVDYVDGCKLFRKCFHDLLQIELLKRYCGSFILFYEMESSTARIGNNAEMSM